MTIGSSANGLKIWFEWVALFLTLSGRTKRGSTLFGGFDKLRDHRLRVHADARPRVPRFSKVINFRLWPNRKRKHFPPRRSLLVTGWSSCIRIFRPKPRGRGFVLNLCSGFWTSFCVSCFVHMRGVFGRILFKLLMNGGRVVWVPGPLWSNGSRAQEEGAYWTSSAITFLMMPGSGTSFQWWTRRRWLCENLKYANSV